MNSDTKDRGVHLVIVRMSWFCVPKIDCKRKETGTLSCLSWLTREICVCFVNILQHIRERMAPHPNHYLDGCPECVLNRDAKDRGGKWSSSRNSTYVVIFCYKNKPQKKTGGDTFVFVMTHSREEDFRPNGNTKTRVCFLVGK